MDSPNNNNQSSDSSSKVREPSTLILPPVRKFTNLFSIYKLSTGFIAILIMILAIPLTITLLSKQQDVRQRASSNSYTLTASPNPCRISNQDTCTTNISWNTQGVSSGSVCVNQNGGPEVLFARDINGSGTQVALWISKGTTYNFTLYKNGCGSERLASVSVTAN